MVSISMEVGGAGGAGGHGGAVNVGCADEYATWASCSGAVTTKGVSAHAIIAQSIGGGGGNTQVSKLNFSDGLGSANLNIRGSANNGNSGHVLVQDRVDSHFGIAAPITATITCPARKVSVFP